MLNEEGGIDPLEFRFYAMVDRVATTGTAWLGLTAGCAQCHTHKYDPISHTEYYRLMALMNNADEPDLIVLDAASAERRSDAEAQMAELEAALPAQFPPVEGDGPEADRRRQNFETQFATWLASARQSVTPWQPLRPSAVRSNLPKLEVLDDASVLSTGDITKRDLFTLTLPLAGDANAGDAPITALRLEALPDDRLPARGPGRAYYEGRQGDFFLSEVTAKVNGQPVTFNGGSISYSKISIGSGTAEAKNVFDGDGSTGWSTADREGEPHQLVLTLAEPLPPQGELEVELLFERHFAASLGRFRFSATTAKENIAASSLPPELEVVLMRAEETWSEAERAALRRQYAAQAPELTEARKPIDEARKQLPGLPTTMVLQERPADNPRLTQRHHRGEYLSGREEVAPGIPAFLAALTEHPPENRLEFACWLVSRENPLAARVEVNRAWRAFFGRGLVDAIADFGTQSEPPSHPALLDWLACEFMDRGWSRKQLHRLIVLSATYRQSSSASAERFASDPDNRWLARGPGHRIDAEVVRDLFLTASGLLNPAIGGPSVYPPQPASVTALAYGSTAWPTSTGPDRYRRSLYTYSKRTAPFAAYLTFDGPSGETCLARRDRSNTPLQALTLLNDEMYLEFARALAADVCRSVPDEAGRRKRGILIFRRLLSRPPIEAELDALLAFYDAQRRTDRTGTCGGESASQIATADRLTGPIARPWRTSMKRSSSREHRPCVQFENENAR